MRNHLATLIQSTQERLNLNKERIKLLEEKNILLMQQLEVFEKIFEEWTINISNAEDQEIRLTLKQILDSYRGEK